MSSDRVPLLEREGGGAPKDAPSIQVRGRHRVATKLGPRNAFRRSAAAISVLGTALPGEDGGETRPLIRPAFAAFVLTASSRRTAEPHSEPGR